MKLRLSAVDVDRSVLRCVVRNFDLLSFEVRVADNGPGIPESIRNTLFDPFVSSGKPNGTGLGLAIVNKIIHDHGGSVSVEQTSEAGTVFLVRLPRSSRAVSASSQATVT